MNGFMRNSLARLFVPLYVYAWSGWLINEYSMAYYDSRKTYALCSLLLGGLAIGCGMSGLKAMVAGRMPETKRIEKPRRWPEQQGVREHSVPLVPLLLLWACIPTVAMIGRSIFLPLLAVLCALLPLTLALFASDSPKNRKTVGVPR